MGDGRHAAKRGPARLPVIGLGLIVAIGALVFVVERQPGPRPPAAGAARTFAPSASPTSAAPSPAPAVVSSSRSGDPLGNAATSYLAGRSSVVLAAVYDLDSRQTWTIGNPGLTQAEASIVKVDILETLFAQRRGGLSAADRSLAQQMIEESDNDAATTLWDAVGGASGIGSFNADAGLTSTKPSRCVQCPGFPWPGWGLSTTTPADQIALLRELVEPGPLLSTADRAAALRLMEDVTPDQRWGVSGGVPAQASVALKDGWLPLDAAGTDWQINSVGWVAGLGRDYLIAVLSTGNPTEQYGIDTINRLSAIVWNGLA